MKNLFIITEEEKKRILNLHESASKRHYLKENYDPTKEVLIVGSGNQPSVIFDKKTKRAIRITDNYTEDVAIRLDSTKPTNRSDAETLAKDPIVMCQYNKIIAANGMITAEEIQKCMVSTGKKATDPNPVKQTPCPVGDKKAVMAFQRWVESKNKGWVKNHPEGIVDNINKGFGKCGPNTKREWSLSGSTYMKELGSPESLKSIDLKTIGDTQAEPELKLSTPTTPEAKAAETPKQTLTQQKKAPNADIDNNIE